MQRRSKSFLTTALAGVNTPDLQMADNDYAVGLVVQKIAKSIYKNDTLVFVIEDDAQNDGDPCGSAPEHSLHRGPLREAACPCVHSLQHH
jgi:hypothetical protein